MKKIVFKKQLGVKIHKKKPPLKIFLSSLGLSVKRKRIRPMRKKLRVWWKSVARLSKSFKKNIRLTSFTSRYWGPLQRKAVFSLIKQLPSPLFFRPLSGFLMRYFFFSRLLTRARVFFSAARNGAVSGFDYSKVGVTSSILRSFLLSRPLSFSRRAVLFRYLAFRARVASWSFKKRLIHFCLVLIYVRYKKWPNFVYHVSFSRILESEFAMRVKSKLRGVSSSKLFSHFFTYSKRIPFGLFSFKTLPPVRPVAFPRPLTVPGDRINSSYQLSKEFLLERFENRVRARCLNFFKFLQGCYIPFRLSRIREAKKTLLCSRFKRPRPMRSLDGKTRMTTLKSRRLFRRFPQRFHRVLYTLLRMGRARRLVPARLPDTVPVAFSEFRSVVRPFLSRYFFSRKTTSNKDSFLFRPVVGISNEISPELQKEVGEIALAGSMDAVISSFKGSVPDEVDPVVWAAFTDLEKENYSSWAKTKSAFATVSRWFLTSTEVEFLEPVPTFDQKGNEQPCQYSGFYLGGDHSFIKDRFQNLFLYLRPTRLESPVSTWFDPSKYVDPFKAKPEIPPFQFPVFSVQSEDTDVDTDGDTEEDSNPVYISQRLFNYFLYSFSVAYLVRSPRATVLRQRLRRIQREFFMSTRSLSEEELSESSLFEAFSFKYWLRPIGIFGDRQFKDSENNLNLFVRSFMRIFKQLYGLRWSERYVYFDYGIWIFSLKPGSFGFYRSVEEFERAAKVFFKARKELREDFKSLCSPTTFRFVLRFTLNNSYLTLTNFRGRVLAWATGGTAGFKGSKRATPYAAMKAAQQLMAKSKSKRVDRAILIIKNRVSVRTWECVNVFKTCSFVKFLYILDSRGRAHSFGPRPKKSRRV